MSYILITPLKNEENHIQKLYETVLQQTIKPLCWVIVDSGSDDNTFQLSNQIAKKQKWIHVTKQIKFYERGYGHLNFSEAVNEGYAEAKKICQNERIAYDFVGKIDATTVLCKNYFKILSSEMNKEEKLVITCGISKFIQNNKEINIKPMKKFNLTGFNDIRLYRKDFFENIGGYPLIPSPDSALLIKATNRNLKVKVIEKVFFKEPRMSGSKVGVWNGSKLKGETMYSLGYHPLLILLNSMMNSFKLPPHYQFLPMLWGYLLSAIKRKEKISDLEIRE